MPEGLWLALWLLIAMRVALELIAILAIYLQPITMVGGDWLNLLISGPRPWSDVLSVWQRWDALWYQQIAEHGYHAGDGTVAFQPLYPLLSRVVSLVFLGHIVIAELVASSAAFVVSMWLLYRLARLDSGPIAARLAVLLTALFPVGFFLLAPFSDGLYLAFSLGAFWFARQGRPWAAGLAGLGAGLTRPVAMFLVLSLAFEYLRQRDAQGKRPGLGLLAATLPVVGMIGLILYQRVVVGETRSIFAIQANWGTHTAPFWEVLPATWSHIVSKSDPVEAINLFCLLAFAVLGLALLWRGPAPGRSRESSPGGGQEPEPGTSRLPLSYALYVLPYLALFFNHESYISPLMSVSRYTLVLFPCFILLGRWLAYRPGLATATLLTSAMVQALLFQYFVHFWFIA